MAYHTSTKGPRCEARGTWFGALGAWPSCVLHWYGVGSV